MSYVDYHDTLSEFTRLRVRPSTLSAFGFQREGGFGWLYTVPIDGTSLECHVSISAQGVISEKVVDLASGDEYTLHRVANATGSFVGQVRAEVTLLLKRIAVSCFERNVFIRNQSRELLETVSTHCKAFATWPCDRMIFSDVSLGQRKTSSTGRSIRNVFAYRNLSIP